MFGLLLLLLAAAAADDILTFPGPQSIENYISFDPHFPDTLSSFSSCSWVFSDDKVNTTQQTWRYSFSFATNNSDNEILFGESLDGFYQMNVGNYLLNSKVKVARKVWDHVCYTWSSGSGATIYVNGELDNANKRLYAGMNVSGEGNVNLVIGQDQDHVGGGFLDRQAFLGKLYQVNFWNRSMSAEEVAQMYDAGFCGGVSSESLILNYTTILKQHRNGTVTAAENSRCGVIKRSCVKNCIWEQQNDITRISSINEKDLGNIEGVENAKSACEAIETCVAFTCNEDASCCLKSESKDLVAKEAKGYTTYVVADPISKESLI